MFLSRSSSFAAVLAFTCPLARADVLVVDAAGAGDHLQIQEAVTAAADGDVILVRAGSYATFVVNDKSLMIVAEKRASVECGTIRVRNLAAHRSLVVSGLRAQGAISTSASAGRGAWFVDCAGSIRIESSMLRGGDLPTGSGLDGWDGARIESCADVVFRACELVGGRDGASGTPYIPAGAGLRAIDAELAVHDSTLRGGDGRPPSSGLGGYGGGVGGHGARLEGSFAHLSGALCQGGDGGVANDCGESGSGGTGLVVAAASTVWVLGGERIAGSGAPPGGCLGDGSCCGGGDGAPVFVYPGGQLATLPGTARGLALERLGRPGESARLELHGEPGDLVWLLTSKGADFEPMQQAAGVWALAGPLRASAFAGAGLPALDLPSGPLGPIPAGGVLAVPAQALAPSGALEAATVHLQAVFVSPIDGLRLGPPASFVALACSASELPDCNANGLNDWCELGAGTAADSNDDGVLDACDPDCNGNGVPDGLDIGSGASADANRNGIPDDCEAVLYVDADAAPGGDGAGWATAFDDLQDALASARLQPDIVHEIWIAEGTYKPAPPGGSRYTSFEVRTGLTLYGGFAGIESSPDERAIAAHPTILSGDLDGDDGPGFTNRADNVVHVLNEDTDTADGHSYRLDGFVIRGGHASNTSGGWAKSGGGIRAERVTLVRCVLMDNAADEYGAAVFGLQSATNCVFVGNAWTGLNDSDGGGAVYADSHVDEEESISGPEGLFTNCLFVGNRSRDGGAVYCRALRAFRFVGCTFAANVATERGGAIYARSDFPTRVTLQSCVLWGNSGGTGTAEEQQYWGVTFDPSLSSHCCIEGYALLPGTGHHGLDPQFVDPLGADGVAGTLDDDLRLGPGSPCIDAGRNGTLPPDFFDLDGDGDVLERVPLDLLGAARRIDDPGARDNGSGDSPLVDMGAHERVP